MFNDATSSVPSPRLGIFWGIGERGSFEIVAFTQRVDDVVAVGGFKTLEAGHVDLWSEVQKDRPPLASRAYDEFPRGRVNLDIGRERYILLADRRLLEPSILELVMQTFGLDVAVTEVLLDAHYRT